MSEIIAITCPACGARFRIAASTSMTGRLRCQSCSHSFCRADLPAELVPAPIPPVIPKSATCTAPIAKAKPVPPTPVAKPVARNADDDIPVAPVAPVAKTKSKAPAPKPGPESLDFDDDVRVAPSAPKRRARAGEPDDFDEPVPRRKTSAKKARPPKLSWLPAQIGGGIGLLFLVVGLGKMVSGMSSSSAGPSGYVAIAAHPPAMDVLEFSWVEQPDITLYQNDLTPPGKTRKPQDGVLRGTVPSADFRYVCEISSKDGSRAEFVGLRNPVDLAKLVASGNPQTLTVGSTKFYRILSKRVGSRDSVLWQPRPDVVAALSRYEEFDWKTDAAKVGAGSRPAIDLRWKRALELVSGSGECQIGTQHLYASTFKADIIAKGKREDGALTIAFLADAKAASKLTGELAAQIRSEEANRKHEIANGNKPPFRMLPKEVWADGDTVYMFDDERK